MTPERFTKLRRVLEARQPDLTILAENVHKAHNIAAIIRTCDAVGILEAHAVSETGEMRRHHMVSGGSRRWVPVRFHDQLASGVEHLRRRGFTVLAAHLSHEAVDYREPDYTRPTALLLGSEQVGVSPQAAELADGHIKVPMEGMVESLNVSVAAALILYEAKRQREAAGMYELSRLEPALLGKLLFEWAHPKIAARCRLMGLPYPPMTRDGDLAANPFGRSARARHASPGIPGKIVGQTGGDRPERSDDPRAGSQRLAEADGNPPGPVTESAVSRTRRVFDSRGCEKAAGGDGEALRPRDKSRSGIKTRPRKT